jgi:hypothetical protein
MLNIVHGWNGRLRLLIGRNEHLCLRSISCRCSLQTRALLTKHRRCDRLDGLGLGWLGRVNALFAPPPTAKKIVTHGWGLPPLRLLSVLTETGWPKRSVRR